MACRLRRDALLNDIVLKAVAVALEGHPALNSALVDGAIHRYRAINLGVAMDVEDGLVVPVLPNAGQLDLGAIASAVADLTARAKAGKLTLEDFEGGTFTVSNLSALGVDWFTPVLNPPQCALLGVGRMRRTPAAVGRDIVNQGRRHLRAHLRPPRLGRGAGGAVPGKAQAPAGISRFGACFGSRCLAAFGNRHRIASPSRRSIRNSAPASGAAAPCSAPFAPNCPPTSPFTRSAPLTSSGAVPAVALDNAGRLGRCVAADSFS